MAQKNFWMPIEYEVERMWKEYLLMTEIRKLLLQLSTTTKDCSNEMKLSLCWELAKHMDELDIGQEGETRVEFQRLLKLKENERWKDLVWDWEEVEATKVWKNSFYKPRTESVQYGLDHAVVEDEFFSKYIGDVEIPRKILKQINREGTYLPKIEDEYRNNHPHTVWDFLEKPALTKNGVSLQIFRPNVRLYRDWKILTAMCWGDTESDICAAMFMQVHQMPVQFPVVWSQLFGYLCDHVGCYNSTTCESVGGYYSFKYLGAESRHVHKTSFLLPDGSLWSVNIHYMTLAQLGMKMKEKPEDQVDPDIDYSKDVVYDEKVERDEIMEEMNLQFETAAVAEPSDEKLPASTMHDID